MNKGVENRQAKKQNWIRECEFESKQRQTKSLEYPGGSVFGVSECSHWIRSEFPVQVVVAKV